MFNTLTQEIHRQTDQLFIGTRFCKATKVYYKKRGAIKTCAILLAGVSTAVYSFAASYFCAEGVIRSYSDVHNRNGTFEGLQGIGNTGEWTSLPILSTLALCALTMEFIHEAEYYKISSIAKKWLIKSKGDEENPQEVSDEIYSEMHLLLDDYIRKIPFSKELYSLTLIKIFRKASYDCQTKTYLQDLLLEKVLKQIQIELDEKRSINHHVQRVYRGLTANRLGGTVEKILSIVGGGILPLIFIYTGICSWVGEGPLAKVIYIKKQNLSEVGHFGEWLMNAVQAIAIASIFYRKCLLHEGDYVIIREIFEKYIGELASDLEVDTDLYNRLCSIANEKLSQVAGSCAFKKLPGDYRFQKIMKKNVNQAEPFIATRQHHDAELAEDYVEVISDLVEEKNEAKICDISKHFGVSHVTVIRAIDRLKKKGLLQEGASIALTKEGVSLAKRCKQRHQFLLHYLQALGVPKEAAAIDVEGMEHHISKVTMKAFSKHLKILKSKSKKSVSEL